MPLGIGLVDGGHAALFVALGLTAPIGIAFSLSRRLVRLLYPLIGIPLAMVRGVKKHKR